MDISLSLKDETTNRMRKVSCIFSRRWRSLAGGGLGKSRACLAARPDPTHAAGRLLLPQGG